MLANAEISTISEMLLSRYRLDGRSVDEYREISFRFPQDNDGINSGCCIVNIGATSVMARVSSEVVEPKHVRPSQGMLYVNFDSSLVNLMNKISRQKNDREDEGRRLSAVLQTLFRDCLDLDALCIVAWERVFAIRVELRALSYDGNLGDCGALAGLVALAAYRRPDVFVQDNGKVMVDVNGEHRPRVQLNLRRIPVLVTVGLSADAKVILQDPTSLEEAVLTGGRVLVGMTSFGEVCCLYTANLLKPIRSSNITKCVHLAKDRAQGLVALVQYVLDGLSQHRSQKLAAAHARSSLLPAGAVRHIDNECPPLVFSTASFVSHLDQEEGAGLEQREEGEIVGDELLGLMSSSDEDAMQMGTTDDEASEDAVETLPKPLSTNKDLYGVIEVSTCPEPTFAFQSTQQFSDVSDFPNAINTDFSVPMRVDELLRVHKIPKKASDKDGQRHVMQKRIRKMEKPLDDEETETTVLQLR